MRRWTHHAGTGIGVMTPREIRSLGLTIEGLNHLHSWQSSTQPSRERIRRDVSRETLLDQASPAKPTPGYLRLPYGPFLDDGWTATSSNQLDTRGINEAQGAEQRDLAWIESRHRSANGNRVTHGRSNRISSEVAVDCIPAFLESRLRHPARKHGIHR